MLGKMNLKNRLIGAFLMMGAIVFLVALLGWSSTDRLSKQIYVLSNDTLPSIIGLWKINQSNSTIGSINRTIIAIATSSAEIAATVEQQERVATHQSAAVSETTTAMDELKVTSDRAAWQAEEADKRAQEVLILADKGTQAMQEARESIRVLQEKMNAIANSITQFYQQASQISNISVTVTELANQTNMLALNARVEAVRAGEQGKGFAVVASEIRRLADESKQSALKINTVVRDIQKAIDSTVNVTDEGTKMLTAGFKIIQKSAEAFTGVAQGIDRVVLNNREITLNAKQQALAIVQAVNAMNAINVGARQTAAGIVQTKAVAQKLNEAAQNLKALGV